MKIKNLRGKYECRKKLCSQYDRLDAFRSVIGIGGEESLARFAIFWKKIKKNYFDPAATDKDIRKSAFLRLADIQRRNK